MQASLNKISTNIKTKWKVTKNADKLHHQPPNMSIILLACSLVSVSVTSEGKKNVSKVKNLYAKVV